MPGGLGVGETKQINHKMNFIRDSFHIFSKNFKEHLPLTASGSLYIVSHKKMHISEYFCKTVSEELAIFLKCSETFKIFLLFKGIFLPYFKNSTKNLFDHFQGFFSPYKQVTLYHSNSCVLLIDTPNERCRFSTQ